MDGVALLDALSRCIADHMLATAPPRAGHLLLRCLDRLAAKHRAAVGVVGVRGCWRHAQPRGRNASTDLVAIARWLTALLTVALLTIALLTVALLTALCDSNHTTNHTVGTRCTGCTSSTKTWRVWPCVVPSR